MKALMYYNQRDIRLEDLYKPEPGNGQVLLRVTDAGLCQTQINEFVEGPFVINKERHKRTGKAMPMVVGHQFGGVIEKCGSGVDESFIGAQVAVLPLLSCGECYYCQKGYKGMCDDIAYYGLLGENGGFAEYACINKENVFKVNNPDILTFIEPILVAINASRKIKDITEKKQVCILGAGAVGLSMAAVLRDYCGMDIVINDILPGRLYRAKLAGFKTVDKSKLKREYDMIVDCAGSNPLSKPSAFVEGFNYLMKGGILLSIGAYFHPIAITPVLLLASEHHIYTSYMYNPGDLELLPQVLERLNVNFSEFIERIKLENIIEEGYYRAEVDMDSYTRLVVVP